MLQAPVVLGFRYYKQKGDEGCIPKGAARLWLLTFANDKCSGQLIPDTALSFSSATAGASPLLN